MPTPFSLPSSDPALLARARRTAEEFVRPLMTDNIVGIVFLGAVARGYMDTWADIDLGIFKKRGTNFPIAEKFLDVDGFMIQIWLSDYEDDMAAAWDMPRRWTYSQGLVHHDPHGQIKAMLESKVPLQPEERKELMMRGLTLSEWYGNDLTRMWVERGSLISAQHMFDQGLVYLYDLLFGLNGQLVPDMKWRTYCAERLPRLPVNFTARLQEVMTLHGFTVEELERRRTAFMGMWDELKPVIEAEVGMTYEQMVMVV